MKKLVRTYEKRIENATKENELKDIVISMSQDCSSYKISWDAFLNLRKAVKAKGTKIGSKWAIKC